eukprot:1156678-Prymnesium_polylepis.1
MRADPAGVMSRVLKSLSKHTQNGRFVRHLPRLEPVRAGALAGKRCRASRCKAEYAARIKLTKAAAGGGSSTATSPT